MSQTTFDTLIVGGGQGGLATSYHLQQRGIDHLVLEQAAQAGNAWRNDRWDSFTLVTPNWCFRLPGAEYAGDAPHAYMPRAEIVATFERYVDRFQLPVQYQTRVSAVTPAADGSGFQVITSTGPLRARHVVIATGLFQTAKQPEFSAALSPHITQLASGQYRSAGQLPAGAVLVVGSGQSGCQIAEELYQSGRKVYLCVGSAGRAPRRYRGKDAFDWLQLAHFLDRTVDKLPSPQTRFEANPHVTGRDGGHSLNLHQFARDGVTLLGRLRGGAGDRLSLAPDLYENLAKADKFETEIVKLFEHVIAEGGLDAPEETLPVLRDGFEQPLVTELDLSAERITTIIWALGYRFDFGLVQASIFDSFGYPVQQRGVTAVPGLYFVGLPWLHSQKSGLLAGVGEDAAYVAAAIAAQGG